MTTITKYTGKPISVDNFRYFLSNSIVIIDTDDKLELLLETLLIRQVNVSMFRILDGMIDKAFKIFNDLPIEQYTMLVTRMSCWNARNISSQKLIDMLYHKRFQHSFTTDTIVNMLYMHVLYHYKNLSDDDLLEIITLYLQHKRYIDMTCELYMILIEHPSYHRMKAKAILLNKQAMTT